MTNLYSNLFDYYNDEELYYDKITHYYSLRKIIDHFTFSLMMNSCSVFSTVGKNMNL